MTIYRNKNWTGRDYECTNLVYQVTDGAPRNYQTGQIDSENWLALPDSEQEEANCYAEIGLDYLETAIGVEYVRGMVGHKFYGYL